MPDSGVSLIVAPKGSLTPPSRAFIATHRPLVVWTSMPMNRNFVLLATTEQLNSGLLLLQNT